MSMAGFTGYGASGAVFPCLSAQRNAGCDSGYVFYVSLGSCCDSGGSLLHWLCRDGPLENFFFSGFNVAHYS